MKLLNSNLSFKGNIDNVVGAEITEAINEEYTLSFSVIADSVSPFLTDAYIVECDDDYFDIAKVQDYRKGAALMLNVDCEHISYRLNDEQYDREYFTEDGTPAYILGKILEGTGFTVGTVEFSTVVTYSAQEKLSARALLMEFASLIGAEIKFNKFTISFLQKRGQIRGREFKIGKNITGIKRDIDYKNKTEGNPKVAYDVDIVELRTLPEFGNLEAFELGETIRLLDTDMGIDTTVRVVKYSYNPVRRIQSSVEIKNRFSTLSDTIFRIKRDTVTKGALYHGVRISAENGFEAIRSDDMARAYFNSDTLAMQAKEDGQWKNKIYFDPLAGTYIFDGLLSATAIEAVKANIDVVVSETIIVNNLYAQMGRIADLTVNRLMTGDFLTDANEIFYLDAKGSNIDFKQAYKNNDHKIPFMDNKGQALYYIDDTMTGMHTEETEWPVMVSNYDEAVTMNIGFEDITDSSGTLRVPTITLGRGDGATPLSSKGRIYKDRKGMVVEYFKSNSGDRLAVTITDEGIEVPGNTGAKGLRNIAVGATPPANPQNNDLWIDTTGGGTP